LEILFLALDSSAWSSLTPPNWIKGIIHPHSSFGIPKIDSHLFQIFATVLCDLIWFARNKAVHEGFIPDISILASSIRRTSLDHAATWQSTSPFKRILTLLLGIISQCRLLFAGILKVKLSRLYLRSTPL
jgi:hypothetical protein